MGSEWKDAPFIYVQRADDAFDVIGTASFFPEYVCTTRTKEWAARIADALEAALAATEDIP